MRLVPTKLAEKRFLIRSVVTMGIMADAALLRGIGAVDRGCRHPAFLSIPRDLLWQMRQMGSPQISILGFCLEPHRSHRQLFIGKLGTLMFRISVTLIHRTVDFLLGLTNQALPAPTTGGWHLFRALFLQARMFLVN